MTSAIFNNMIYVLHALDRQVQVSFQPGSQL